MYIPRLAEQTVKQYLEIFPAVAILGPRQSGKSTLVKHLAKELESFLYVDLQNFDELTMVQQNATLFFEQNKESTICLDEIQSAPQLFKTLRSVIDKDRRNGKFILLGSASRDLIQHTSESLAGRIGFIYLPPFMYDELRKEKIDLNKYWFRGGFPESYLATNDTNSSIWRASYISTYIERDIPQLGFQIPPIQLRRFLTMCSHYHAQTVNLSKLASSMGLTHPTIRSYIDLFEQTFIIRTIQPFEANIKKRLVKTPKLYFRDSGILHQLLQLDDFNQLLMHPGLGASWEGFVIENLVNQNPDWTPYFYRTASGEELDLVMVKGRKRIAIECKVSTAPQFSTGFWKSIEIVKPKKVFVVCPIEKKYPVKESVIVCGLGDVKLE